MRPKKTYNNFLKNKDLRRKNQNIRKIRDGKGITFWAEEEKK